MAKHYIALFSQRDLKNGFSVVGMAKPGVDHGASCFIGHALPATCSSCSFIPSVLAIISA